MPRKLSDENYARREEKVIWHPCGLQSLNTRNFTTVANRILAGQYNLLKFKYDRDDAGLISYPTVSSVG